MAIINWDDKYKINIKILDEQHKNIFTVINDLHESMLLSKGNEIIPQILKKLQNYIEDHFSTEEKHMKESFFPGLHEQIDEHAKYIKEINNFKEDLRIKNYLAPVNVFNFTWDWITHHIIQLDMKYRDFLKTKKAQ